MKLTIVRGIPGSGKSSYSKKNFNCCILENDQFSYVDGKYQWSPERVRAGIAWVRRTAEDLLRNGADVCVCNTFVKSRDVNGFKDLALKHGADFEVIHVVGDFGNIHDVPEDVLKRMKETFESYPGEKVVSNV